MFFPFEPRDKKQTKKKNKLIDIERQGRAIRRSLVFQLSFHVAFPFSIIFAVVVNIILHVFYSLSFSLCWRNDILYLSEHTGHCYADYKVAVLT